MSTIGRVSELCRSEEYALIAPSGGGPSVFIPADEFGSDWRDLAIGMAIRFSSVQGARGPKAYNVTVLSRALDSAFSGIAETSSPASGDGCAQFTGVRCALRLNCEALVASVLTATVPEITREQISMICKRLMEYEWR